MRIAYVALGAQSGVTENLVRGLVALGHRVEAIDPTDVLALRDPKTRLPRPTPRVLMSLAASAYRFGLQAMNHRWNTAFAFDAHSRRVAELLAGLAEPPDIVLQAGALFASGAPPIHPYVLMCDSTSLIAQRQSAAVDAEIGRHVRYSRQWLQRERVTYERAEGIAVFSDIVRRSLLDDYGIAPERVALVGAGANIAPAEIVRRHDGRSLLFIGRDFRRKGGPVLLRAFRRLREKYPDVRLTLVGPTEPIDLPEGVTNLGLQPFERVADLLREATIFVLPTLHEPFGIAFLDAMVSGVPCVGTNVGAIPEILGGVAGLTVEPADVAGLVTAIGSLLDDPSAATAMGAAGRTRVIENGYLWPKVVGRLEAVLNTAINPRRTAPPLSVRART